MPGSKEPTAKAGSAKVAKKLAGGKGEENDPNVRELVAVVADGAVAPVWDDLDSVLLVGGLATAERPLRTTEIFNARSLQEEGYRMKQTHKPGPDMRERRWGCATAWIDVSRIIVIGGFNGRRYLSSTEIFDIATATFSDGPRMLQARAGCTAVRFDEKRLLVIGGYGNDTTEVLLIPVPVSNSRQASKPGRKKIMTKQSTVSMSSSKSEGRTPQLSRKGTIMSAKGTAGVSSEDRSSSIRSSTKQSRNTSKESESESMRFVYGPKMQSARACCAAFMLDTGRLLVAGGYDCMGCSSSTEVFDVSTAFRCDPPEADEWVDLAYGRFFFGPPLLAPRAACAGVKIDLQRALLLGGFDGAERIASTEILDIKAMSFSPGPSLKQARSGCGAILVGESVLLIVGGCGTTCDDAKGKENKASDNQNDVAVGDARLGVKPGEVNLQLLLGASADSNQAEETTSKEVAIDGAAYHDSMEVLSFTAGDDEASADLEFKLVSSMLAPRGYMSAAAFCSARPEVEEDVGDAAVPEPPSSDEDD